jgi:hypothetical protein
MAWFLQLVIKREAYHGVRCLGLGELGGFGIEKFFAFDPLKYLESMTYAGVICFESD